MRAKAIDARSGNRALRLIVAAAVAALAGVAGAGPASAQGILPPSNPAANVPAPATFTTTGPCQPVPGGLTCQSPCFSGVMPSLQSAFTTIEEGPACVEAALSAIDAARAAEGVGPMELPTNFASLSLPEQIFVVTDLERVDRGVPPLVGLAGPLSTVAQAGASAGDDPALSRTYGSISVTAGGAVWAGGQLNPLLADYDWVYNDGWGTSGSNNIDCTGPGAAGCWGHRDILLGAYTGTGCTACVMGAAFASTTATGSHLSYAALVIRPASADPDLYFTWAQEAQYLPAGGPGGAAAHSPVGAGVAGPAAVVGIVPTGDGRGYWLPAAGGSISSFGDAGSAPAAVPGVVGMAAGPGGQGLWLAHSDGSVQAVDGAPTLSPSTPLALTHPVVGLVPTSDHHGYWLIASDGGVFSFGDAAFHGSTGAIHLNRPIVGGAPTPDGGGYWLIASDGGIFTFGDAAFHGSTGAIHLNRPIVGGAPTPDGGGYWLIASDGGIFTFGDAAFHGSTGAIHLNQPIVGGAPTPDGGGYWLVAADGGIFTFGNAGFFGSGA